MTKAQAEAAVNLLSTKYPDAAIESDTELADDADEGDVAASDYSVALNGTVADSIGELVEQLKEDFGDDAEVENIIAHIEALERPDVERALG